jgi:ribosome-binding protein aMBF1 (putative translation factor)
MSTAAKLRIAGQDLVVLTRTDYLRLVEAAGPAALKDAREMARASIAASLRRARETAGLTQAELAKRLRVSQPLVASAESGKARVGERYAARVLKACGLPRDWAG